MNRKQAERFVRLSNTLAAVGLSETEISIILRAERALGRWAELECGDERGNCIERDENTGTPYMTYYKGTQGGERGRYQVADREAGALRRVKAVCDRHGLAYYHQTDPRGCALYIIRPGDVRAGASVDSCYTNGVAVCID